MYFLWCGEPTTASPIEPILMSDRGFQLQLQSGPKRKLTLLKCFINEPKYLFFTCCNNLMFKNRKITKMYIQIIHRIVKKAI